MEKLKEANKCTWEYNIKRQMNSSLSVRLYNLFSQEAESFGDPLQSTFIVEMASASLIEWAINY